MLTKSAVDLSSRLNPKASVALNKGSRPLVELDADNKMSIVCKEIVQDKIYLDASDEVRITGEGDDEAGGLADLNPVEV